MPLKFDAIRLDTIRTIHQNVDVKQVGVGDGVVDSFAHRYNGYDGALRAHIHGITMPNNDHSIQQLERIIRARAHEKAVHIRNVQIMPLHA